MNSLLDLLSNIFSNLFLAISNQLYTFC